LILLYNAAARDLFEGHSSGEKSSSGLIGLGRSVFGIIDRSLVTHALEIVRPRIERGEERPVSQFVTTAPGGQLIRVQLAPVRGASEVNGFVLMLDDVTAAVQGSARREQALQSLAEQTRA